MGASASVIPYDLYKEIMHDIAPIELEDIDVTIKLANRDTTLVEKGALLQDGSAH